MTPDEILAAADLAASQATHVIEPKAMVPGLTMHLDADYLAYYASGNDETTQGESRLNAIGIINTLRTASGADKVVCHSSSKGCNKGERYLVATVKPYQGQREGSRKPKNHEYLQNWLQTYEGDLFRAKVWATREADDGIAYLAQWHTEHDPLGYCVIATADKDMRMLPGLHVTWKEHRLVKVERDDFEVKAKYRHLEKGVAVDDTKVYGTKWFWLQMLMGDAADNIPGLEKWVEYDGKIKPVGEKTAALILGPCDCDEYAYETVIEHYQRYYGDTWADRFVEQATLLWLRRDRDALLDNFYAHFGGPVQIQRAIFRLQDRVANDRRSLNQIAS